MARPFDGATYCLLRKDRNESEGNHYELGKNLKTTSV